MPNVKIVKFSSGKPSGDFGVKLQVVSEERVQIRHYAIDVARVSIHRKIELIGETESFLTVKVHPHMYSERTR